MDSHLTLSVCTAKTHNKSTERIRLDVELRRDNENEHTVSTPLVAQSLVATNIICPSQVLCELV